MNHALAASLHVALLASVAACGSVVQPAAGGEGVGSADGGADGEPGDAGAVDRTPTVVISDGGSVGSVTCPVFEPWLCTVGEEFVPTPCCMLQQPPCTSTDLRGQTCAGLAFAGGTLACGAACTFDATGCDPCAKDPHVVACGRAPVDATSPAAIALAATDTAIIVAWITSDQTNEASALHVARFAPDLTLLNEVGCLDVIDPRHVELAAVADGWILAAEDAAGVQLIALDVQGQPLGQMPTIRGARAPLLVAQPGAGALLGWLNLGSDYEVMLVGPDGHSQTAPAHAFDALVDAYAGSGVFTGGGFLVAQRTSGGVALAPVALDGTVGAPVNPVGDTSEFPQLAWTGAEVWMTFGEFGASSVTEIVRVDAMGRARETPQPLGVQGYRPACPVLPAGTDVLALVPRLSAPTGGSVAGLDVVRRAADGGVAGPAFAVARGPEVIQQWRFVRRGADAIAGWIVRSYPGGVQLARVIP